MIHLRSRPLGRRFFLSFSSAARCFHDSPRCRTSSPFAHLLGRSLTFKQIITPVPSTQLIASLRGFIPDQWLPEPSSTSVDAPSGRTEQLNFPLDNPDWVITPSHHTILFNPHFESEHLLPDGTDKSCWPGPPFWRRLWIGGTVTWNHDGSFSPPHTPGTEDIAPTWARLAECTEKIVDVTSKTSASGETTRVDVSIERTCGTVDLSSPGDAEFVETRKLVFLPLSSIDAAKARPSRNNIVKGE